ncbi:hypothetical protein KZ546_002641, partial [Enterococcus faecalis]|nr:hypothetical protein [Enterococcus faecalis]
LSNNENKKSIIIEKSIPDVVSSEPENVQTISSYNDLEVANKIILANPRGDVKKDKEKEQRRYSHSNLEITGIFLPRGKEIKVTLTEEPEKANLVIGQYGSYQALDSEVKSSDPVRFSLVKGENILSRSDSDGMVYLENKSYTQQLSISLEGGVDVPHYALDTPGSAEKFKEDIQKLKGIVPFFEIEGKYAFGTFQMSQIDFLDYENVNRLPELVNYWDQIVLWTNEAYGFNSDAGYAASKNLNQRIHITNPDTGGGYAFATENRISFQVNTGASKDILSKKATDGQWGVWHEIGHTYQNPYYNFDGMTEVFVNISPNYIRKKIIKGIELSKIKLLWPTI